MKTTIWMVAMFAVGATMLGGCSGSIDTDAGESHTDRLEASSTPPHAKSKSRPAVACPAIAFDCDLGSGPIDRDGDGCDDSCGAIACPAVMIDCMSGYTAADTNGDGCIDACTDTACPPVSFLCAAGFTAADTNGDGCVDGCIANGPPVEVDAGTPQQK